MCKKFPNFRVKYQESSTICLRSFVTSGSSIKSQVLDLKTLLIFSPLKISVITNFSEVITIHWLPNVRQGRVSY